MSSASTSAPGESSEAASQERAAAFIARWKASSGSERSNYVSFLNELADLLEVPRPDPATTDNARNAYVFERAIEMTQRGTTGYIDLYKRGCFVCETKQGVERDEESSALSEKLRERRRAQRKGHGIRGTAGFDQVLIKARNQAEGYARNLPADEGRPPFLIVADVGHSFELFAEFTRSGGVYTPFPDASSHRIHLADLQRPEIRERLRLVWTDPLALDPARRTAAVTREVAAKLAALSRSLEASGHDPRAAAYFLIRCIFTMFSEDVELLPKGSFSELLKSLRGQIHIVPSMLEHLWKAMDRGDFCPLLWFRQKLLRFNGGLFREPSALAINEDQLELLIEAAACDWRDVEPAIFGTLLERALEPTERHKLGAHYTPRAYVERLVLPTVIEPLRADWQAVQAAAAQLANEDKEKQARKEIETFHRHLCHIRVLDPACGTGNFLYVTLEHLKRLEGEVLDTLERFGGNRRLEIDTATVRPSQMLGIEINPRAAVIAELVLWIGYLQWHLRTSGDVRTVSEPVLEDAQNIETRDAILAYDEKEFVLVAAASSRPKSVAAASSRLSETNKRQDAASTSASTSASTQDPYRYFNPQREIQITQGNLPHWRQEDVTYFVTFRLADSIPQERLEKWRTERDEWQALNPPPHTDEQKADYFDRFSARMEEWLDAGHGSCCLKDPECRAIVEGALRYFDGNRYTLGKFTVAPNHVHVLVTPKAGHELSAILHSWKSYTGNEINKRLNRGGALWQKEFYDHIVRSPGAAYRIEQYIANHDRSSESKRQDAASTVAAASSRSISADPAYSRPESVAAASSRSFDPNKRQDAASTGHPIYLTHWDGRTTKPHPVTGRPVPDESAQIPVYHYKNPRPAQWPKADFIVGNPPFIGASRMRDALGDGYVEAVRTSIQAVPESADFVMYWWNHAADLVRSGQTRRFGFVTTNSIRQTFNRRVLESHLTVAAASSRSGQKVAAASSRSSSSEKRQDAASTRPLSLLFAIPDHPWVDDLEAAAVRVAMTVAEAGNASGLLQTVEAEEPGDEAYKVTFREKVGKIAADLTIGADVTSTGPVLANSNLSSRGVMLFGSGFILTKSEAKSLGYGKDPSHSLVIRPYLNGRDLTAKPRNVLVIDLFGYEPDEVRQQFPEIFQWILERVKPERDQNRDEAIKKNWWLHGRPRVELREYVKGLPRYIATVETSKHRFFQFLDASILPDNKLVNIALDDAYFLGILSSRIHVAWAMAAGSTLEDRPVYVKSTCFETFPFPDCTEAQKARIRELGEALDAHRKARQAANPDLTMTGMYNVLEKLRDVEAASSRSFGGTRRQDAAATPVEAASSRFSSQDKRQDAASTSLTAKEKTIHEHGLVSILKQLHDDLDAAVADAYGWPADLTEEDILTRLVALNHERAAEEKRGHIRWLRPEYQAKGEGRKAESQAEQGEIPGMEGTPSTPSAPSSMPFAKAPWPKALPDQIRAVRTALATLAVPANASAIAQLFTGARKDRIEAILESLQALGHAQEVEDGRYSA